MSLESRNASDVVISSGTLVIEPGVTSSHITVASGAELIVDSGGTAEFTKVLDDGYLDVSAGGIAISTTLERGADAAIEGVASGILVSDASLSVEEGGISIDTVLAGGGETVAGVASDTTVDAEGGILAEPSRGVFIGLTVNAGGNAILEQDTSGRSIVVASGGRPFHPSLRQRLRNRRVKRSHAGRME